MTYKGHIKDGTIVLDGATALPEGAVVRIEILEEDQSGQFHKDVIQLTGILPSNIDARDEYAEGMRKKHQ